MMEVKRLKSSVQAKYKKKILFYYRFGSANKRKRKNYMTQISDQVLIMLHDVANLPGKKLTPFFRKDFGFSNNIKSKKSSGGNRIKAKHQIIEDKHGMKL
jgi:hypothetical protein